MWSDHLDSLDLSFLALLHSALLYRANLIDCNCLDFKVHRFVGIVMKPSNIPQNFHKKSEDLLNFELSVSNSLAESVSLAMLFLH